MWIRITLNEIYKSAQRVEENFNHNDEWKPNVQRSSYTKRLICLSRSKWPHSMEINSKFSWHFFLLCVLLHGCGFCFSFSFIHLTIPLYFGDRNSRYLHVMKHVACVFAMIACNDWPHSDLENCDLVCVRSVNTVLTGTLFSVWFFYFIFGNILFHSFFWWFRLFGLARKKTDQILSRLWWWNGSNACSMNSI